MVSPQLDWPISSIWYQSPLPLYLSGQNIPHTLHTSFLAVLKYEKLSFV